MASSMALKLACAIVVFMAIGSPYSADAMGCNRFLDLFTKCIYYARGLGPLDRTLCCGGLQTINREDTTTAARQTTCRCMVGSLNHAMNLRPDPLNPTVAAGIPRQCGVSLPYPISTSAKCDSVQQIWSII